MTEQAGIEQLRQQLQALEEKYQREIAHSQRMATRLHQLMDLLPAGVLLLDKHGCIQIANPAAAGLLGEPLIGERWRDIIQRSFAPRSDDGHEISLKDGRRVSLKTQAMGAEPGQLLLLTDQTDTRLLQSRLAQYQRLSDMGRMVASLAHQIRTPLSAAMLYADHLNDPTLSQTKQTKVVARLKARLRNLEQHVSDMLVFARAEVPLNDLLQSSDLLAILEDMLDLPLSQHDADCDLINNAAGVNLRCNQEVLCGAMLNLVNNALQATGQGGHIQIRLDRQPRFLCWQVIDQGAGMSEQQLAQATQPFFTTKSHGTGLGLAIARMVAKAHGGYFELVSQVGVGTQARVYLPYLQAEQQQVQGA